MDELKAKTRYALLAALDLARHSDGSSRAKVQEIAARTGVPAQYLVHILLKLKRRALVNSARGPAGGYWLVRPPDRITAAEVVAAVEEDRAPSRGALPEEPDERAIEELWRDARRLSWRHLAGVTLADLLGDEEE